MNKGKGIKIAYRILVLLVLAATLFFFRAEQQAQAMYMSLQERCIEEYAQLPANATPDPAWSLRCALEEEESEINAAMQALDAAQKPFLASAVASVLLLLLMAAVYLVQRGRRT